MRLSAIIIKALSDPGRYSDGDGLHLYIGKTGSKSWVQRITIDGRRRDVGLGGYPAVSLAQARKRAADNRAAIADGRDPLSDKRKPEIPTLKEAAYTVHSTSRPSWRNEKHAASWIQTLERHALPKIGNKRIDKIGRADVLTVLTPIWTTRPETARRVRQRVTDNLSLGNGVRLHRDKPSGRNDKRGITLYAESEGTLQGTALP